MTSRAGFPSVCAQPVTVPAGQAALVADVYQKWIVGAAPQDAQNAGVLFENASNPGSPQVQSILRQLADYAAAGVTSGGPAGNRPAQQPAPSAAVRQEPAVRESRRQERRPSGTR